MFKREFDYPSKRYEFHNNLSAQLFSFLASAFLYILQWMHERSVGEMRSAIQYRRMHENQPKSVGFPRRQKVCQIAKLTGLNSIIVLIINYSAITFFLIAKRFMYIFQRAEHRLLANRFGTVKIQQSPLYSNFIHRDSRAEILSKSSRPRY